jgi:uncharacterized membrane protein
LRSRLLASTFVLTILVLTIPALVGATDSFTIEANPTTAIVTQGASASYTITVGSFSGLPVTLGVTGLPSGATAAFNPPSLQPPVGGTTSSALTVTARVDTPVGSYPLNVTASDSSGTHWVIVTLNVLPTTADFEISVSPNSLTINTTESKTATVTVQSIASYSQNTTLSVTGLPAHVTATFTPPAPRPLAISTANSIMTITVGADAVSGTYPLTVVGTVVNGMRTRSVPFTLIVIGHTIPPVAGGNVGLAFAFVGIGLGVAAAGAGLAIVMSGRQGAEVLDFGGYYYCRKHRVPLWYVEGRLWCPLHQRHVRTE